MSFADIIRSLLEIAMAVFIVWAIFHEEKFIVFEEKLICKIRRRRLKTVDSKCGSSNQKVIRFN